MYRLKNFKRLSFAIILTIVGMVLPANGDLFVGSNKVFAAESNQPETAVNVMRQPGSVVRIEDGPTPWDNKGKMWPNGINDGSDGTENYSYPESFLALTCTSGSSYNVGRGNTITFSSSRTLKQFVLYSSYNFGVKAAKKYKIDALINGAWENVAEVDPSVKFVDSHAICELNFLSNTKASTAWRWYISQWDDNEITNYYIGEVEAYENPGIVISANFPIQDQILYEKSICIPCLSLYDLGNRTLTCKYFIDSEATPRGTSVAQGSTTGNAISLNQLDTSTLSEGEHTIRYEVTDGISVKTQTVKFTYSKATANVMRQPESVIEIGDGPTPWDHKGKIWPNGINDGSDGIENYSFPVSYLALTYQSGSYYNTGRGNTITFSSDKILKQFKIYSSFNTGAKATKKYRVEAFINGTWQSIADVVPIIKNIGSHTVSELNFVSNTKASSMWRWYINDWDENEITNYYIGEIEAYEIPEPVLRGNSLICDNPSFDSSNPQDIIVNTTGAAIKAVRNGSSALTTSDYSISGNTVTIKKSYLTYFFNKFNSPNQKLNLIFDFDGFSYDPVLTVTRAEISNFVTCDKPVFDSSNPQDITVNIAGANLKAIKNGPAALSSVDYSISGNTITIKKGYLTYFFSKFNAPWQKLNLIFDFEAGNDPLFTVTPIPITNLINGPVFDLSNPQDISVNIMGNTLVAIKNGLADLKDVDYSISGNTVTIKKSYLTYFFTKFTEPWQKLNLTFDFEKGNDPLFTVSRSLNSITQPTVTKVNEGVSFPSQEGQIKILYRYPDYTKTPIPAYTKYTTPGNNIITENIECGKRIIHNLQQTTGVPMQYVTAGTNTIILQSNVPKNTWTSIWLYADGGTANVYVDKLRLIFDDGSKMTIKEAIDNGIISPLCLIHTYYNSCAWTNWNALYNGTQTDTRSYPKGDIILKSLTKELKGIEFYTNVDWNKCYDGLGVLSYPEMKLSLDPIE